MTTNNKLIVEFLGYTQPHPDYPNTTYWYKKDKAPLTVLLFDTDWNWLMEVVEKIELNNKKFGTVTLHGLGRTKIDCYNNEQISNRIDILDQKYGIAPTYNACIEFIKWYNNEK